MTGIAITFPTTHDMLKAEAVLSEFLHCKNIPAPPDSSSKCTTALLVDEAELEKAKLLMEKERVTWDEIKSKPSLYDKFVKVSIQNREGQNREGQKQEGSKEGSLEKELKAFHDKAGVLDEEELLQVLELERNSLNQLFSLFSENINLSYSYIVPTGSCNKVCHYRCGLSEKNKADLATLDWVFNKIEGGFDLPIVFLYGESFDQNLMEYLESKLNKLEQQKIKPSLVYLGKAPMSLSMKLLSKGSSMPCDEHVLTMKEGSIIKEILFARENMNPVLASQSLIPVQLGLEGLTAAEKLKLERSIACFRLSLGYGPIIGAPDIEPDIDKNKVLIRGESVRFRWLG